MGSAADAIENLTGVRPTGEKKTESTYNIPTDDSGPAASAMRNLLGIAHPATFAERFDATREKPLQKFTPQEKPDFASNILTGFENTQLAASQRTAPNPSNYKKLVSSETYQNDAGDILYDDPVTGKLTKTDRNKHVILRDPQDNKFKVYERSEKTDEGMLSAAGRMLGTGLATGAPVSRAYQTVAAPAEEIIGASQRLSSSGGKVAVPRAISSDNPITQEAGAIVRNIPIANAPLTKAAETTLSQLGEKATELSGKYGSSSSADAAGNTAKESIRDWITTKSEKTANKLYDKVDELVDPNIKAPLTNTTKMVDKINAEREAAGLKPSKAGAFVSEALSKPSGKPELNTILSGPGYHIAEEVAAKPGLTYGGVKTLRTSIGEQLKGGILPEGTSQGELKRIYGALTEDLGNSVRASGGPAATAAFERANRYYRLASDRRESLAKIIGSHGDAPAEAVFDKIKTMAGSSSRADISKLGQARKVMGADDWNEVASTIVGRLGRDVEGNFSARRFLTEYGKMSPAGKNLLLRSGGKSSLAESLDDIATISSRFKELEKYANPSGTSRSVVGALIAHTMGVEPLTMAKSVLGGRLLASYLANPAGASSIAKWSRANLLLAQAPTPARLAAFETASRNLISTTGAKVTVGDFLKALQSPATSRADEEKVPGIPGK